MSGEMVLLTGDVPVLHAEALSRESEEVPSTLLGGDVVREVGVAGLALEVYMPAHEVSCKLKLSGVELHSLLATYVLLLSRKHAKRCVQVIGSSLLLAQEGGEAALVLDEKQLLRNAAAAVEELQGRAAASTTQSDLDHLVAVREHGRSALGMVFPEDNQLQW
jgi:hypothetical protein